MSDATELIEVLFRRHRILRTLTETPRKRYELVDESTDSKSTVYKGVSQLLEADLIEQTNEGLRPTLFGSVALSRYEELARTADFGPLIDDLSPDTIDPVVFVGAELITPDADSVGQHLDYAQHLLETANTVRGVVPAATSENISLIKERASGGQLTAEFVVSTELADILRREQTAALESLLDEEVTLWECESEIPFGFFTICEGDMKKMGIEFRDGNLVTGLLLNDTVESVNWAKEQFNQYRVHAEHISVPD